MVRLLNKIAVVTGGARGMGEATVRQFLEEGARIVIADLLPVGEALAKALGDSTIFVRADISREEDWQQILAASEKAFGTPDVLVNNAAMQRFRSILECDVGDFRQVLDVNLVGTFLGLKSSAALWFASGGDQSSTSRRWTGCAVPMVMRPIPPASGAYAA